MMGFVYDLGTKYSINFKFLNTKTYVIQSLQVK